MIEQKNRIEASGGVRGPCATRGACTWPPRHPRRPFRPRAGCGDNVHVEHCDAELGRLLAVVEELGGVFLVTSDSTADLIVNTVACNFIGEVDVLLLSSFFNKATDASRSSGNTIRKSHRLAFLAYSWHQECCSSEDH